ncbi:hypothetical protein AN641_03180 [Candidatus Epulonipiscioides gigas]|nr:hypothetical protein AN641_03180 [Epulopiscium sp. SCG-C07WGA-EpuloA2]
MQCDFEQLSLYIDDELDLSQRLKVKEHIQVCENCQSDLQALLEIKEQLSNLEEITLPENFHNELMNKITPKKNKSIKYYATVASFLLIFMISTSVFLNSSKSKIQDINSLQNLPQPQNIMIMEQAPLGQPVSFMIELNAKSKELVDTIRVELDDKNLNYADISTDNNLHYILESELDYKILIEYLSNNQDKFEQIPSLENSVDAGMIELIIYYP